MPVYRIYRLKENPRQQFKWQPHVSGTSQMKRNLYEEGGEVEAANEYAAWQELRGTERELGVGDILETPAGELRIFKYVGFEAAEWFVPELKTGLESVPPASGPAGAATGDGAAGAA
jgi:hypothetical protein